MTSSLSSAQQLNRAKRQATACLIIAAALFIAVTTAQSMALLQTNPWWLDLIKMMAEAALVGGLADWFAISALFKPIPAKNPIPHTNIVATNQNAIARNLSKFVKDKFFHEQAVESLIARSQPACAVGKWLKQAENAERLSHYITDSMNGMLLVIDDEPIQQALKRSIERGVRQLPLTQLLAAFMRVLTKDSRHQLVVNVLVEKLAETLANKDSQAIIAEKLSQWLKEDYSRLEKVLPSSWLSEQGARIAVSAVSFILQDINTDPQHPIRCAFDQQIETFICNLERDPELANKVNHYREGLLKSDRLAQFLQQMWFDMHNWLGEDLQQPNGRIALKLQQFFTDTANRLDSNKPLQLAVDQHIGHAARYLAPEMADFLASHIQQTIESWDATDMARQVELNIGKDLQKVRINGTLVGGLIGGVLFGIEALIGYLT